MHTNKITTITFLKDGCFHQSSNGANEEFMTMQTQRNDMREEPESRRNVAYLRKCKRLS